MRGEAEAPPGEDFLAGGGAMGARVRAHDWAATPLGPPEAGLPSLRIAVGKSEAERQIAHASTVDA